MPTGDFNNDGIVDYLMASDEAPPPPLPLFTAAKPR